MSIRRAYLDHNATTPIRAEAAEAIVHAMQLLGNPSSIHAEGRAVRHVVEDARENVARLVHAKPQEVIFTSGGTEAANLAFHAAKKSLGIGRLIISVVEHDAVRASALALGLPVEFVPVDAHGRVDLGALARLLEASPAKTLVALMFANNETGVIQPVEEAVALTRAGNALFLCDATQAAGKVEVDFAALDVDMLLLAAHKLGGPLGVGALIWRDGLDFSAWAQGGGQEFRRRAGSENVPGIAGFGAAAQVAAVELDNFTCLAKLRDAFETRFSARSPDVVFFGRDVTRLANTSYFSALGLDAQTLLIGLDLDGIAVSAGAACSSGKNGRPRVLEAMGVADELARGAIRMSLGRSNEEGDIERLIASWLRARSRAQAKPAGIPSRPLAEVEY